MYLNQMQVVRIIVSEGSVYEMKSKSGDFFVKRWNLCLIGKLNKRKYKTRWSPTNFDRFLKNVRDRKPRAI